MENSHETAISEESKAKEKSESHSHTPVPTGKMTDAATNAKLTLDLEILKAQFAILKDGDKRSFEIMRFCASILLAMATLLVGYGWYTNKVTYERDKERIVDELKRTNEMSFDNLRESLNQNASAAIANMRSESQSVSNALISDLNTSEKALDIKLHNSLTESNTEIAIQINAIKRDLRLNKDDVDYVISAQRGDLILFEGRSISGTNKANLFASACLAATSYLTMPTNGLGYAIYQFNIITDTIDETLPDIDVQSFVGVRLEEKYREVLENSNLTFFWSPSKLSAHLKALEDYKKEHGVAK